MTNSTIIKTVAKNTMAILLLTMGTLFCIASLAVILIMEGHLDSIMYTITYIVLGLIGLISGLILRYIVSFK